MKKYFYIALISVTAFISFGFRGCDDAYCEFLFNLNSAVGRFSPGSEDQFFIASDSGIYFMDDMLSCFASLVSPEDRYNFI